VRWPARPGRTLIDRQAPFFGVEGEVWTATSAEHPIGQARPPRALCGQQARRREGVSRQTLGLGSSGPLSATRFHQQTLAGRRAVARRRSRANARPAVAEVATGEFLALRFGLGQFTLLQGRVSLIVGFGRPVRALRASTPSRTKPSMASGRVCPRGPRQPPGRRPRRFRPAVIHVSTRAKGGNWSSSARPDRACRRIQFSAWGAGQGRRPPRPEAPQSGN